MSALFNHAMRYEWVDRNPISLVRQSAKRERVPEVLTVEDVKALLSELQEPYRTMAFLAAATGLRVSELLGLKWLDIDFGKQEINLVRGIVHQIVGEMKTEASRKPIPMADELADALRLRKKLALFNRPDNSVFANPEKSGEQPVVAGKPVETVYPPGGEKEQVFRKPWASTRFAIRWEP